MEFTEDSLSFNFFHDFSRPYHKHSYAIFVKILQYFHNYQLKKLSIKYLSVEKDEIGEITKLIDSNRAFLISLEVDNLWIGYEASI